MSNLILRGILLTLSVVWVTLLFSCSPTTSERVPLQVSGGFKVSRGFLNINGAAKNIGSEPVCVSSIYTFPSAPIDSSGTFGFEEVSRKPQISKSDGGIYAIELQPGSSVLFEAKLRVLSMSEIDVTVMSARPGDPQRALDEVRGEMIAGEYEIYVDAREGGCAEEFTSIAGTSPQMVQLRSLQGLEVSTYSLGLAKIERKP